MNQKPKYIIPDFVILIGVLLFIILCIPIVIIKIIFDVLIGNLTYKHFKGEKEYVP